MSNKAYIYIGMSKYKKDWTNIYDIASSVENVERFFVTFRSR